MTRMAYAVVAAALLGWCANPARAETLPQFVDIPGTYTPGTPFTFEVRIPQVADLTSFHVELVFSTDQLNPSLFVSAAAPDVAPGGRYVFSDNSTFQSGSSLVLDSNQVSLTFQDSTGTGVLSQPGQNDTLAIVTVQPGAGLTGPITISLGSDTQFVRNMEERFTNPAPVTVVQADVVPTPAPAPASAVLLGIGGLALALRRRIGLGLSRE